MIGRSLKVLLVMEGWHPPYSPLALRFKRYAGRLREQGISLEVLAGPRPLEEADAVISKVTGLRTEVLHGVRVQRAFLPAGGALGRTLTLHSEVLSLCRGPEAPELVLLPEFSWESAPLLMGLRLLRVASLVGFRPEALAPSRALKAALSQASAVFVPSEAAKRALCALRTQVEVIPEGVDHGRFRPSPSAEAKAALRLKLGLRPEGPLLVAALPASERDPLMQLLTAGELPVAVALLPSATSNWNVARQAERAGARLVGAEGDGAAWLRAADLFYDGGEGPVSGVVEAMACGLVVLSTRGPWVLSLGADLGLAGETYLAVAGTPGALRRGLVAAVEARATVGALARQRIVQGHTLDGVTRRLAALCGRIPQGRPLGIFEDHGD